jgi:hypothetical protein
MLGWKYVAEDFDDNWLIFKSGPSEMAKRRSEWKPHDPDSPLDRADVRRHQATIGELRAKGRNSGVYRATQYGRVIMMIVPGADDISCIASHKLA